MPIILQHPLYLKINKYKRHGIKTTSDLEMTQQLSEWPEVVKN